MFPKARIMEEGRVGEQARLDQDELSKDATEEFRLHAELLKTFQPGGNLL